MEEIRHPRRINLKNMTGTFAIFVIACGIAFMAFLLEMVWSCLSASKGTRTTVFW